MELDNRITTYSTLDIDFFAIENVTITDKNGFIHNAAIIAMDGFDSFTKKYNELFTALFNAYYKS